MSSFLRCDLAQSPARAQWEQASIAPRATAQFRREHFRIRMSQMKDLERIVQDHPSRHKERE